jgi:hypothetical protein
LMACSNFSYMTPSSTMSEVSTLKNAAYVSIRQHTSAYVSIRQHTSAYVSIRQHTSAYVSVCQHDSEQHDERGKHTLECAAVRQCSYFCTSKASKLSTRFRCTRAASSTVRQPAAGGGTQFTCFTGTKVQILTYCRLPNRMRRRPSCHQNGLADGWQRSAGGWKSCKSGSCVSMCTFVPVFLLFFLPVKQVK